MENFIGKMVLVGTGDVLEINGERDQFFTCKNVKFPHLGIVLVSKDCVVSSDGNREFETIDGKVSVDYDVDFFALPKGARKVVENSVFKELEFIGKNVKEFNDIYISLKKFGDVKVSRTTDKSVFFFDKDGKERRTAFKNILSVKNYGNVDPEWSGVDPEWKGDFDVFPIEKQEVTKNKKPRQTISNARLDKKKKPKKK